MADRVQHPYGEIDIDVVKRWFRLPADEDQTIWMINLMKYKAVAEYAEGAKPETVRGAISGKAADDSYSPLASIAAVGAMVAFHGDVLEQSSGDPAWDRIGIIRYPSRSAFFTMQERDEFKKSHVHKAAGMEFTIVMGCLPKEIGAEEPPEGSSYVMRVRKFIDPTRRGVEPAGVTTIARFDVDGTVIGDERTWDEVRFDLVTQEAMSRLGDVEGVADGVTMVVSRLIDNLVSSVQSASERG